MENFVNKEKNMKVLAHDLEPAAFAELFPELGADITVIDQNKNINPCLGSFGCWVKTPSSCVLKDDFQRMGELYDKCDEMIVVSKCTYGCYSPFIKNVMDRSVTWILPLFVKRNNEMHHPRRYENRFKFTVHFYGGDISLAEKQTAEKLVKANAVNLDALKTSIHFHEGRSAMKGAII